MTEISDDLAVAAVALIAEHGSIGAASRASGIPWHTIHRRAARAAERGLDGEVPRPIPPGRRIRGVSTLYSSKGEVVAQWVKDQAEGPRPEDLAQVWREAFESYAPLPVVEAPPSAAGRMLAAHFIVDHHHGLRSYRPETGRDYDIRISARLLREAQAKVLDNTPPAAEALMVIMGDYLHANDSKAETPASGHRLDVDSRPDLVMRTGAEMAVEAVDRLRRKHGRVKVRVLKGNHDPDSSIGIALAIHFAFRRDPRVEIDLSPALWWFHRHGLVLLGFTHGHTCRPEDMVPTMAAAVPGLWGKTRRRVVYHAHYHRRQVVPSRGGVAEGLAPSTPADAYAAGLGFFTGRAMVSITHCARTAREFRVTECLDSLDMEPPK